MVLIFGAIFSAQAIDLHGIRVWPSPDKTRVVFDLSDGVKYSYFTLTNPDRLVLDLRVTSLKNTNLPIDITNSPVLSKIRTSTAPEETTLRLVLENKYRVAPYIFLLAPTPDGHYGHRLVVDLPHKNPPTPKASAEKSSPQSTTSQPQGKTIPATQPQDVIVAIDAGHGGEDPGAIGPTRKYEKYVTLAIAQMVAKKINAIGGMKAVLTRDGDYFVNLNQRSEIARKNKAHMLISIHADGFHQPGPRGASVWVLSTRRANTEIGRWIEQHEKHSELLGGGGEVLNSNKEDPYLSRMVLDLQFSNSQKEGYSAAVDILGELGKIVKLHKKKPEHASLAVLKSPDIPSVLVEVGFISNPTEERLLFQQKYRSDIADAIHKGIWRYFKENPPNGLPSISQQASPTYHQVQSGESLSVIAAQNGISLDDLKSANNLKSNTLKIGQRLVIPTGPSVTHKVKRGEFLSKIAQTYGVSVDSIRNVNGLNSDKLAIGQILVIPR